ncbi:MAG: T9SS type A sorting domain-containing protein [Saprospiraceae bacterium]|nr:T9SS type A sorting domain-containing protein [Saprospiraceae bacterium]
MLTSEVPILGTTVQPQLPYFILHAPPGDGSTAEFQETKTVCREMVQSAATDNSSSGYVDVKVGVAGSVGFIATVNFEFSVTVGASAGGGEMSINTVGNQTCLTVTEGFQTPPGGEDVFVGYGTDLAYGVTSEVRIDSTCQAYLHPVGLAYMPIGQPRQFYYTKSEILDQIAQQQLIVDDTTLSVRARNDAQNQVDVWNKVLALNDANINNPNNVQIGAVSYGTVPSSQESSITVTETASIEYEQYVDYSASLDVVVEVGGSGVSGGYEYRGSQRYGKIENQSQELTKIVRYTLSDDDPGDLFNINIFRDPMFGTPVFRTAAGTKSSCPYQGGYQRDQPKLKHDGTFDNHIALLGAPIGSSATFKVDICNESNEARTYNLKLNAQSNLNGAVVSAAGVPLNGNDLGQSFTVPANSCVQDLVVEVKQLSANSPLAYPNLELFLYAPCEENIQSNVFASVFFGNATSTDETQGTLSKVALFPNPASDIVNIAFELAEPAPVRLEVRDLLGRLLMTGFDENRPAGTHQTLLNVSQLPGGMYILGIQSGAAQMTQKLIVQR